MKALKLFVIFTAILAVVVTVLWISLDDDNNTPSGTTTVSDFQKLHDEFTAEWEHTDDWNQALFDKQFDKVQLFGRNLKQAQTHELIETINTLGSAHIYEKMFNEFHSPTCRKAIVDTYKEAIDHVVSRTPHFHGNARIMKMNNCHKKYTAIYKFVNGSGYPINPGFNGQTWTAFSNRNIPNTVRAYQNDPIYKADLSNIQQFRAKFSQLISTESAARASYYDRLASQVRSYYAGADPTAECRNELRAIQSRFHSEYGPHSGLDNFVASF